MRSKRGREKERTREGEKGGSGRRTKRGMKCGRGEENWDLELPEPRWQNPTSTPTVVPTDTFTLPQEEEDTGHTSTLAKIASTIVQD